MAGFDVLDQSIEVKLSIGYLPETPRFIRKWRSRNLSVPFVAKLKGIPAGEVQKRVDEACRRTAIADVKNTIMGKLSKGYRQRVGCAQAIITIRPCQFSG